MFVDPLTGTTEYEGEELQQFLASFCADIDAEVESGRSVPSDDSPYRIVLIGSAAVLCSGIDAGHTTEDIDVFLTCLPQGAIERYFGKYAMNTKSKAFGATMHWSYEDRVVPLLESEHCRIERAGWEDLIYAKLQRYNEDDIADIDAVCGKNLINWELLDELLCGDEAAWNGMTRSQRQEQLIAYDSLLRKYGFDGLSKKKIFELMDTC